MGASVSLVESGAVANEIFEGLLTWWLYEPQEWLDGLQGLMALFRFYSTALIANKRLYYTFLKGLYPVLSHTVHKGNVKRSNPFLWS